MPGSCCACCTAPQHGPALLALSFLHAKYCTPSLPALFQTIARLPRDSDRAVSLAACSIADDINEAKEEGLIH
jgi:hypothetical protein